MAYATQEAREQLLGTVAEAIDELGAALGGLGAAYEKLDEGNADRLEDELFRAVQTAYGRLQRTHAGFAERHGLPGGRGFEVRGPTSVTRSARDLVEDSVEAVTEADNILSDLQDSMMPVEVGDPELRAGLAEVRELVGGLAERARSFLGTLGR